MPSKDPVWRAESNREWRVANQDRVKKNRKAYAARDLENQRRAYAENPEKKKAHSRKWRQENLDAVRAYDRERSREEPNERRRARHLKSRYGLTPEEFYELRQRQSFCCKICRRSEEQTGYTLVVDHDNNTKKVRGLLCFRCNTAIGQFGDDPDMLRLALDYLTGSLG